MFTNCLSCGVAFARAHMPGAALPGDRLAYDPSKGRLWSICRSCRSWTLAPIEARWEVVESLERLTTTRGPDRPRLLAKTDRVALFERGTLQVVRVGTSDRAEEAWWRYGLRLETAWRRERRLSVGHAATAGAAIVAGVLSATLPARYAMRSPSEVRRWLRFGDRAWTGHGRCPRCDQRFAELSYFDRTIVRLRAQEDPEMGPSLTRRCPGCSDVREGGLRLVGTAAEQTLSRVLAYQSHPGVPEGHVRRAVQMIDREGGPVSLVRVLVRHTEQFGDLPLTGVAALAIAANEQRELRLLRLEAAVLEEYWRDAEAVAAIVDGELTPHSGVERLRLDAVGRL